MRSRMAASAHFTSKHYTAFRLRIQMSLTMHRKQTLSAQAPQQPRKLSRVTKQPTPIRMKDTLDRSGPASVPRITSRYSSSSPSICSQIPSAIRTTPHSCKHKREDNGKVRKNWRKITQEKKNNIVKLTRLKPRKNSEFHPLEVMGRVSETQLQADENNSNLAL